MRVIRLLFVLFICAVPATADTVCTPGNFSSIVGTTCSIGSLTFTFTGTSSIAGGWTASDLYLTPATNGFTLNFLGGPQTLTANNPNPLVNLTFDELGLSFNVTAPQGSYFNGVNFTSAGVFNASGFTAFASGGFISSTAGGAGSYVLCTFHNCPTISAFYPAATPFSSTASADVVVFGLWAGSGTAHWDGSPSTFTFSLDNNAPEPTSLSLLVTGLLVLMGVTLLRKRLAYNHG